MKELFYVYSALKIGRVPDLPEVHQYGDYIAWLGKQDDKEASSYWNKYLEAYELKASLPRFSRSTAGAYVRRQVEFRLDSSLGERLRKAAEEVQATLNTLLQAGWGILLQNYNNTDDVVFGSVSSGRPYELKDVETIIGLFINTMPVRVQAAKGQRFAGLLKEMQLTALASEQYTYYPLYEIQNNTSLKQNLFEHIMVFENYPVEKATANEESSKICGFALGNMEVFEQTSYDLNIIIIPQDI